MFFLLQFAQTAKRIKNNATVNQVLSDEAMMKRYKTDIKKLQQELDQVIWNIFLVIFYGKYLLPCLVIYRLLFNVWYGRLHDFNLEWRLLI